MKTTKRLLAVTSLLMLSIMANAQTNIFPSSGDVGIGKTNPEAKLHVIVSSNIANNLYSDAVDAVAVFQNYSTNPGNHYSTGIGVYQGTGTIGEGAARGYLLTDNNTAISQQINTVTLLAPAGMTQGINLNASDASGMIHFFTGGFTNERMRITAEGNVGIGTLSPSEKLSVLGNAVIDGNITAKKVTVTQTGWPDYVFHPSYKLKPLSEIAQFIKQHQHLPDVPSAHEVEEKGISLGDNQVLLLKKIEELTLYLIEMKKENSNIKKEMEELKKKVNK